MGKLGVAVLVCVAACNGGERGSAVTPRSPEARLDGPIRVAFGDCAPTSVAFVSAARPASFDPAAFERERAKPVETPPPPPPEQEPSMALDEGKMGKKDSDRAEGQYKMKKSDEDPQLARQQQIEAARNAGILGSAPSDCGAFASLTKTRPSYGSRFPSGPKVIIEQPTSVGDLDKAIIRRYVRHQIAKIKYCYEKQLSVKPGLAGTVTVDFTIDEQGRVAQSRASGVDNDVADCVAVVVRAIEFPKPKNGKVDVTYPFTFSNGEAPAPPPSPPVKRLAGYEPGVANPLRAHADALVECFRANTRPYGVAAIDLDPDPAKTRAYGTDADRVRACLADVGRKVAVPTAQRCAIAFGTMSPGELVGIDVDANVTWNGTTLVATSAVASDETPAFKVGPLYDALVAHEAKTRASAEPVTMRGPVAIRALDATPMKVVNRIANTARVADVPFVFAAQRDRGWRLLRPIALPVVPVPAGTGGDWENTKGKCRDTVHVEEEERVTVSLLVDKDAIWVALSRVGVVDQIANMPNGRDWALLKAKLKEHKASAFFGPDRADLEIAGDDDVSYGDVVRAIDVATEAGFGGWMLTDPQALTTTPRL
jgi:hypothetical protein